MLFSFLCPLSERLINTVLTNFLFLLSFTFLAGRGVRATIPEIVRTVICLISVTGMMDFRRRKSCSIISILKITVQTIFACAGL
jgi:hypothetical protein